MQAHFFAVALFALTANQALADDDPISLSVYDYHNRIGVPAARRIQLEEEQMADNPSRVVGGVEVFLGQRPYAVGIRPSMLNGEHSVCGGAMLSNTRVVTAAHCWFDGITQSTQFTVVYNSLRLSSGGIQFPTNIVRMHDGFNPFTGANNIAMVTTGFITYSPTIQAIRRPTGSEEINNNWVESWGDVTGWGKHNDSQSIDLTTQSKRTARVQIIANSLCAFSFNNLQSTHMCTSGAGSVGICDGDSGSPLTVVNDNGVRTLVAIVAFAHRTGCTASHPSVYTRIGSYNAWINQHM